MTTPSRLPLVLIWLAACPDDGAGGDTTLDTVTADTVIADTAPDTTPDTSGGTSDDAARDTADATPDADPGDGDASSGDLTIAVPGARCALDERVGLIEISAPAFGPNGYVSGAIADRPFPWYGAPELTTDACAFHRQATTACPACDADELCGRDGQCAPAPQNRTDVTLTLSAGDDTQTFTSDGTTGDVWGDITLAGGTLAAEITFAGHRVTLAATPFPAQLAGLAGTLAGGYDAPTSLDITWTSDPAGGVVFTHIPINHHAGGPTFTTCAVPASSGAMHVGEAMLTPLAVSTGLEFQGVHHLRFAAAETPYGCVELRITGGQQYVNLESPN